jgi:hypothetical protein
MQAPENRLRQLLRHGRYRQRPSAGGLVHVQGGVTPAPAEAIRQIMTERVGEVDSAGVVRGRNNDQQSDCGPAKDNGNGGKAKGGIWPRAMARRIKPANTSKLKRALR